jgi:hypothetical protein
MKYCDACNKPCESTSVDQGYYYEYGSIKGYHHDIIEVSECCHDEIINVSDDVDADVIARYVQRYNQLPTRIL